MFKKQPTMDNTLRVRLNVTSKGTLMALNDRGAVIHLLTPHTSGRQTTLTIERAGERALHLPAQVIRTVAVVPPTGRLEHHVEVQFLPLAAEGLARLREVTSAHDRDMDRPPVETRRWDPNYLTA